MSVRLLPALLLALACGHATAQLHHDLDATLAVPFVGAPDGSRQMELAAAFPQSPAGTQLFWQLQVRDPEGELLSTQTGELNLSGGGKRDRLQIAWPAAIDGQRLAALPSGFYTAQLHATALEPWLLSRLAPLDSASARVAAALALAPNGVVEQQWEFQIGTPPKPSMPDFIALPGSSSPRVGGRGALPYTVYLGNFHSQSNHSDGGGAVATCDSAQSVGTGEFGPADAFAFADNHGLDFLMVSEHNHYFDGSVGSTGSLPAAQAIALYQSGRAAANHYNSTHPQFLAIYGMEWGVTDGGGHLNVLGSDQLWGWEVDNNGQLYGDVLTPRSDYPALYAQMQASGTIGQFNHPNTNHFIVGGVQFGYSATADEVMVLLEILNTSAFSNRIDEGETSNTSYAGRFNTFLERGFHVAPASNQDNHCANWGASAPNRTGVLIANGSPLNHASLMEALRARRVYATADKSAQIVLTAGSRLMGERFEHSGPLTLNVGYASSTGRTVAQVQIFQGVPQRNGTVTTLVSSASHTFTPDVGEHFYYARITQDDGKLLWSAPLWVTQVGVPVVDPLFTDGFEYEACGARAVFCAARAVFARPQKSPHFRSISPRVGSTRPSTRSGSVGLPALSLAGYRQFLTIGALQPTSGKESRAILIR